MWLVFLVPGAQAAKGDRTIPIVPLVLEPWLAVKEAPLVHVRAVRVHRVHGTTWVEVWAELPTPCHIPHAALDPALPGHGLRVRIVATPPAKKGTCVQVLQPVQFRVRLPFGDNSGGVRVNGVRAGG